LPLVKALALILSFIKLLLSKTNANVQLPDRRGEKFFKVTGMSFEPARLVFTGS